MDDFFNEKVEELAKKNEIPVEMLSQAIALEREKIVLQNRRLTSKLSDMIERYALSNPQVTSKENEA